MLLRLEGRAIYTVSTNSTFGPTTPTHYVATAGVSVFHLGAPTKPADKDGIAEKKDGTPERKAACPNTPPGAILDTFHIDLTAVGSDVRMLELSLQPTKYVRENGRTVYTWDYKRLLFGRLKFELDWLKKKVAPFRGG